MQRPDQPVSIDELYDSLEAIFALFDKVPPSGPIGELRTPCSPDEPIPAEAHKHLCKCGTCWRHSDNLGGLFSGASQEQFNEAHSCPSCGAQVTWKHGYKEQS